MRYSTPFGKYTVNTPRTPPSTKMLGFLCGSFTERPRSAAIHAKSLSRFSNEIIKFGRSLSRLTPSVTYSDWDLKNHTCRNSPPRLHGKYTPHNDQPLHKGAQGTVGSNYNGPVSAIHQSVAVFDIGAKSNRTETTPPASAYRFIEHITDSCRVPPPTFFPISTWCVNITCGQSRPLCLRVLRIFSSS